MTIVRGNHQFGLGGSVAWWKSLSQANVRSPGQFTFNGSLTGLPLADFLSGRLQSLIQATPNSLDMQQFYMGLYAQDTWKVSPKVTFNYGLRWEPGLRAADPQRGDLQLQCRSFPRGREDHAVRERAARIPLSR